MTVSGDVPVLFATEIMPIEHVAAGLTEGDTVQASVTLEGLSPPDAVIVTVDFADPPGAIDEGDSGVAERPNAGEATGIAIAADELTLKSASPLYDATMLCVPALSAEVEKVATPLPFTGEISSCVVPSMKVTVPVGTPEIPGLTVAVNVTV